MNKSAPDPSLSFLFFFTFHFPLERLIWTACSLCLCKLCNEIVQINSKITKTACKPNEIKDDSELRPTLLQVLGAFILFYYLLFWRRHLLCQQDNIFEPDRHRGE
jgi:hypothetical protein